MKPTHVFWGVILTGIVILSLVVGHDLAPGGRFVAVANLSGYHPAISPFFPAGRMSEVVLEGDMATREILQEPVYVTVRVPRQMQEATVRLRYRAENLSDIRLGLQLTPKFVGDNWRYAYVPLSPASIASRQVAEVKFSLSDAAVVNQRLRFILSAPGYPKEDQHLVIENVEIELSGEPLSVRRFLASTFRMFWRGL